MHNSAEENGRRPITVSDDEPDAVLTGWHFWLVILAYVGPLRLVTVTRRIDLTPC